MMKTWVAKQSGLSMPGFLITVVVLVLAGVSLMNLIPAYIQNQTIKSKFIEVAHDSELQNASEAAIRVAYRKRVTVSDITAIKPDDIDVTKDEKGIILSASYSVKIPLAGNISLLLEFNPTSATK
jgi:hypothetical protein